MTFAARTRLTVAGLAIGIGSVVGVASVGAQEAPDPYVGPSSTVVPEVLDEQLLSAGGSTNGDSPTAAAAVQGSTLALTGGDAVALLLIGGTAVAAGTGMVMARRRQIADA